MRAPGPLLMPLPGPIRAVPMREQGRSGCTCRPKPGPAAKPFPVPWRTPCGPLPCDQLRGALEFGPDPDVTEVDRVVRQRMQDALDALAAARRFPVLG